MECRFGILSQMVNFAHAVRCQPQYLSNVCMKINAKLGGVNSKLYIPPGKKDFFTKPTMIIGCDVSHGGANFSVNAAQEPSMAAMTVSMNRDATRYAASCQTNGYRCEIISPQTVIKMLRLAVEAWCQTFKCAPQHVFYIRDGVSEGQFNQVLRYEIDGIRQLFAEAKCGRPLITCIIATKRHHIRFFPDRSFGDRNGNALPGTLVEREVTHPHHYDFYLCSHVAIQGTARPVHYTVLLDEVKMKMDDLQRMIYHHSYQYARSTTPVSLHPAVYYAHLACTRARAHEAARSSDMDPQTSPREQKFLYKGPEDGATQMTGTEPLPLLAWGQDDLANAPCTRFARGSMWYI